MIDVQPLVVAFEVDADVQVTPPSSDHIARLEPSDDRAAKIGSLWVLLPYATVVHEFASAAVSGIHTVPRTVRTPILLLTCNIAADVVVPIPTLPALLTVKNLALDDGATAKRSELPCWLVEVITRLVPVCATAT